MSQNCAFAAKSEKNIHIVSLLVCCKLTSML